MLYWINIVFYLCCMFLYVYLYFIHLCSKSFYTIVRICLYYVIYSSVRMSCSTLLILFNQLPFFYLFNRLPYLYCSVKCLNYIVQSGKPIVSANTSSSAFCVLSYALSSLYVSLSWSHSISSCLSPIPSLVLSLLCFYLSLSSLFLSVSISIYIRRSGISVFPFNRFPGWGEGTEPHRRDYPTRGRWAYRTVGGLAFRV